MIAGSGLLVLVGLVLLVRGATAGEPSLVHASIAVSLASFALLSVAVRRLREQTPAPALAAPAPTAPAPADGPAAPRPGGPAAIAAPAEAAVLVVSGGTRYHRPGCRELDDRGPDVDADTLAADLARREGFLPCEVCRP